MRKNVKARFTNGVFVPEEEVGIEEGAVLIISFDEKHLVPLEERIKRAEAVAGSWKGLVDGDALIQQIYEDRRRGVDLPPDADE